MTNAEMIDHIGII